MSDQEEVPEEEEEVPENKEEVGMEDMEEEAEEVPGLKVEPDGFGMEGAETEFHHAQASESETQFEAEQMPILDSIVFEQKVAANRRREV